MGILKVLLFRNGKKCRTGKILDLRPKQHFFQFFLRKYVGIVGVIMLLLVLGFFAVRPFFIKASVAVFYPTNCLGGWENVHNIEGEPQLLSGEATLFNEQNSAYLNNRISQVYCGGFKGVLPQDSTPQKIILHLSWAVGKNGVVSGTVATSTPDDTFYINLNEDFSSSARNAENPILNGQDAATSIATSTSILTSSSTPTSDPTPNPSAEFSQTPVPSELPAETPAETPVTPTLDETSVPTESPVEIPIEVPAVQIEVPADPAPAQNPVESTPPSPTSFINFFIPKACAESLTNETSTISEIATTSETATTSPVLIPVEDSVFTILYTLDGKTWNSLGSVTRSEIGNKDFEIPVDNIQNQQDLSNIQINIQSATTLDQDLTVYLDGMSLEVQYENSVTQITKQEIDTDTGKLVTISAENEDPENPLVDVLASTKIPEIYKVGQEDKIKIKWKNNDDQNISFRATDTDEDGYLDYVEWTVPHLSEQTFEIIFISKAFKLDADRNIIADIYSETQAKDGNYVSLTDGQYARATFSEVLDSTKDNTIYARPTDGSQPAMIEVYPVYTNVDGNVTEGPLIDTFPLIDHEGTYKVLLTNLQTPTDVFDLKIIGNVDIDYIVDPSFNDAADGNWNDGPTWGNAACSPSCVEGTDFPGPSDTAVIDSNTVTLTATQNAMDVTISGGTLTAGSQTLNVYGTWLYSSGTFNANTGTVIFTATATGKNITSGGQSFNNVTFNGTGGGWSLQDAMVTNNFTVTAGAPNAQDYQLTINGNCFMDGGNFIQNNTGTGFVILAGGTALSPKSIGISVARIPYNPRRLKITGYYTSTGTVTIGNTTSATYGQLIIDGGRLTMNHTLYFCLNTTDSISIINGGDIQGAGSWYFYTSGNMTLPGFTATGSGTLRFYSNGFSTQYTLGGNLSVVNKEIIPYFSTTLNASSYNISASTLDLGNGANDKMHLDLGSGAHIITGSVQVLSGSTANTLNLNTSSLSVGGSWNMTGITLTAGTSTVTLTGTAAQTITPYGQPFYNLTVNKASGTATLAGALTVNNKLYVQSGTLDTSATNYAVDITGDIQIATSTLNARGSVITVGGNWDSSAGTFTYGTSNVTMTATSTNVTMTTPATGNFLTARFYNLTINSGSNKVTWNTGSSVYPTAGLIITGGNFEVGSGQTAYVNGAQYLTNNGTLSGAGRMMIYTSDGQTPFTNNGTISVTTFEYDVAASSTVAPITATTYGGGLKIVNASASASMTAVLGAGTLSVTGNLTIYNDTAGKTLTLNNSTNDSAINVTGNLLVGNSAAGNGVLTCADSATPATLSVTGDLTISTTGTITANNTIISVGRNWDSSAGTFTYGTSIVNLTGDGTVKQKASVQGWYKVSLAYYGHRTTLVTNALRPAAVIMNGGELFAGTVIIYCDSTITDTPFSSTDSRSTINLGNGYVLYYITKAADASHTYKVLGENLTVTSGGLYFSVGNALATNVTFALTNNLSSLGIIKIETNAVGTILTTTSSNYNITITGTAGLWTGGYNYANHTKGASIYFNGSTIQTTYLGAGDIYNTASVVDNLYMGSSTVQISGNFSSYYDDASSTPHINTWVVDPGTSTVTLTGTAAQTITPYGQPFYNLTVNKASGTATLAGALTVNNKLYVQSGTLDTSATNYAVDITGDIQIATSTLNARGSVITVGGNWTNSGTFTAGTGTVTLNGTGAQSVSGDNTWYGLSITGTTTRTVSFESGKTQTIAANGTLTFQGAADHLLSLAPITAATPWKLAVSTTGVTQSITYTSPSYSDASGVTNFNKAIDATNSSNNDGGNNTNWSFGTVSCSVTPSSTSFGTLDSGTVNTSSVIASSTMTCTFAGGCTMFVQDSGSGSSPGLYAAAATNTPLIASATATLAAGTEGYGIQATTTAAGSGAVLTLSSTYYKSGDAVGGLTTTATSIANSTSPVTGREVIVTHKAAISALTVLGSYSDTITYSCVGN